MDMVTRPNERIALLLVALEPSEDEYSPIGAEAHYPFGCQPFAQLNTFNLHASIKAADFPAGKGGNHDPHRNIDE
jgi:hypothetical protein